MTYLRKGKFVRYNGKEWQIASFGHWGVRLERGFGEWKEIVVVQPYDISNIE